jgi:hypothetical protein
MEQARRPKDVGAINVQFWHEADQSDEAMWCQLLTQSGHVQVLQAEI